MDDVFRIGTVHDVNAINREVRVYYEDTKIMSGWMKVLKNPPFIPQKRTGISSGGSGYDAFASHSHEVEVKPWLPDVGDVVLCGYMSGFNGDGYVLGAL